MPFYAGLPQGSCISPSLYNIFIADLPTDEKAQTISFADDTAILSTGTRRSTIIKNLNAGIRSVEEFFSVWHLSINADKSEAIFHAKDRKRRSQPDADVLVEGKVVPFSTSIKYLGITIDRDLLLRDHVNKTRQKLIGAAKSVRSITMSRSKVSPTNRMSIAKCILLPIATYGAEIWAAAADTHLKRLQSSFQRHARSALGLEWRHPTTDLNRRLNIASFIDVIRDRAELFNARLDESNIAALHQIARLPPDRKRALFLMRRQQ